MICTGHDIRPTSQCEPQGNYSRVFYLDKSSLDKAKEYKRTKWLHLVVWDMPQWYWILWRGYNRNGWCDDFISSWFCGRFCVSEARYAVGDRICSGVTVSADTSLLKIWRARMFKKVVEKHAHSLINIGWEWWQVWFNIFNIVVGSELHYVGRRRAEHRTSFITKYHILNALQPTCAKHV